MRRRDLLKSGSAYAFLSPQWTALLGSKSVASGTVSSFAGTYYSGAPVFASGTLVLGAAWVSLLSAGSEVTARFPVNISGGIWFSSQTLVPASAGSYRVALWAGATGGTALASAGLTVGTWSVPSASWRASLSSVTSSPTQTTLQTALMASVTGKNLPSFSLALATQGAAMGSTSFAGAGTQMVTATLVSHGLSAGQWISLATGITGVPAGYYQVVAPVSSSTYTIMVNAVTGTGVLGSSSVVYAPTPAVQSVTYNLNALVNGGFIYGVLKGTSAATFAGSTGTTVCNPYPSTYSANDNVRDRGNMVLVPANAGAQSVTVTLSSYDYGTAAQWFMGAFAYNAGGNNDLWGLFGDSATHYSATPIELRLMAQQKWPGCDPVFVNFGYPGATYAQIYSATIAGLGTSFAGVPWGFMYLDGNMQDVLAWPPRPYATDPSPGAMWTGMQTCLTGLVSVAPAGRYVFGACGEYFNAPDKAVPTGTVTVGPGNGTFSSGVAFHNTNYYVVMTGPTTGNVYSGSTSGTLLGSFAAAGSTDVGDLSFTFAAGGTAFAAGSTIQLTGSRAVGGLTNQANGMAPYNTGSIVPGLRGQAGVLAIDPNWDVATVDTYSQPMQYVYSFLNGDGTAASVAGNGAYGANLLKIYYYGQTGVLAPSTIEEYLGQLKGPIPAGYSTRLQALVSALPSTANAVAGAIRSWAAGYVPGFSNTYVETGTGAAANPFMWWDLADFNRYTTDSSGVYGFEQVQSVTDRVASYPAGTAAWSRPGMVTGVMNGQTALACGARVARNVVTTSNFTYLDVTDSTTLTAFQAALGSTTQAFTLVTVHRPSAWMFTAAQIGEVLATYGNSNPMIRMGYGTVGSTIFRAAVITSGGSQATISDLSTNTFDPSLVNRTVAHALTFAGSGGLLKLWRNQGAGWVQLGTSVGAYSKGSWATTSGFRIGAAAAPTVTGGFQGMIGDVMLYASDLSGSGDLTTLGTYLVAKWGIV